MVAMLEQETMPDAIEATLNYIVETGEKIFTQTGAQGSLDVRTGGQQDPRRITIRNGRPSAGKLALEQDGFRFVRHDTKVADFFDEDEVRRVYYPEMEALVKAESGAAHDFANSPLLAQIVVGGAQRVIEHHHPRRPALGLH